MNGLQPGHAEQGRRTEATIGSALNMIAAGLSMGDCQLADMEILLWAEGYALRSDDPRTAAANLTCTLVHLCAGALVDLASHHGDDVDDYAAALQARAARLLGA